MRCKARQNHAASHNRAVRLHLCHSIFQLVRGSGMVVEILICFSFRVCSDINIAPPGPTWRQRFFKINNGFTLLQAENQSRVVNHCFHSLVLVEHSSVSFIVKSIISRVNEARCDTVNEPRRGFILQEICYVISSLPPINCSSTRRVHHLFCISMI
jgi:hypothetical protein